MKLPFGWLPGHWGLKGRARDHAKIDHEIDDPMENKLAHLEVDFTNDDLVTRSLDVRLEYGHITQAAYDSAKIELLDDETEKAKQTLELLYANGDITHLEYSKELANREGLPWFHIDVDYVDGELELITDWNENYITMLREVGYKGTTAPDVIDEYVRDFGRKLGDDDNELPEISDGMTFIKNQRDGDMVSYQ